ncbi:ThiF family adenylyltransferase [Bacillus paramycoides]|uniref:HesA/MoeB/ThiF family protein n=1 Tax=Bacillus paramycoides TaxID=2026194 RepID=UPI002E22F21F|nr:ThiF family adenylyltransferase [Bacillus paramycoides]
MKIKLRSSISIIERKDQVIEFFKTNTREQVLIKTHSPVLQELLSKADGSFTLKEYVDKHQLHHIYFELEKFIEFLHRKGILSNVEEETLDKYDVYRRNIHFIEDYSTSPAQLVYMWNNIRQAKVAIVGLGAVGTWVATNLIQSGVQHLILMDNDIVENTNLHRQFGYKEKDIGRLKAEALKDTLQSMNQHATIDIIAKLLDEKALGKYMSNDVDLIINCADIPNVDVTSLWIGEYCMKYRIPHIVGGGYNMHLSLIGQTVLPYDTACVKCFEKQLKEINKIDPNSVRKLSVKNRKIGSFGPMCALIASFIGMEAIKVLTRCIRPANVNRRGEFNIYTMDTTYREFERLEACEWCGGNQIEHSATD